MAMQALRVLIALSLLGFISASANNVICYHGTWAKYRTGAGHFDFSDVPAKLCTHYIYAFAGLNATTSEVALLDPSLDITNGGFASAVNLTKINPKLKVLLAIGGWNEGSAKYSDVVSNSTKLNTFANSIFKTVKTYGFHGFDLDWEYPARREGSRATDKVNFCKLIKTVNGLFKNHSLLLTAAVSAPPAQVDVSYDVPCLSKYLNFINVMAYDFHVATDNNTGHNAPLYVAAREKGTAYETWNGATALSGWLERGAPASKLAFGVPMYGHTFKLANANKTSPGAKSLGEGGPAGPYSATSGILTNLEIAEQFKAANWTKKWDNEQQVPYAINGDIWLSYENPKSIKAKVDYAKSRGIKNIMLWSLENEDSKGISGTKFPLLNAINAALKKN